MAPNSVTDFIARWAHAAPSERANSQLFLSELCDLLNLPHPDASAIPQVKTVKRFSSLALSRLLYILIGSYGYQ
jgi:hypothetical protein